VARATGRLTVDLGALRANYQQLVDAAAPGACGAPKCGGQLRVIAAITRPDVIQKLWGQSKVPE
jgi:hypothetical protein